MVESSDSIQQDPSSHDHSKQKKVYFGVPVVGFFRQNQPAARDNEGAAEQPRPRPPRHLTDSLGASKKNVTFQLDNFSSSSSSESSDDEERASLSSISRLKQQRVNYDNYGYGSISPSSSMRQQAPRTRSGKELWAIVRRHVFGEDFHIRDTVRSAALFQSVGTNRAEATHYFRNIDLPYDFTLLDCCLVFVAYLAISVIAYSFVFEQWPVIDSMYFACVTFTTIGMYFLLCYFYHLLWPNSYFSIAFSIFSVLSPFPYLFLSNQDMVT